MKRRNNIIRKRTNIFYFTSFFFIEEGILSSNAKAITAKLSIKGSGNFLTGDDKNNINVWKIGNEAPLTVIFYLIFLFI